MPMGAISPLVRLCGITKCFPGVIACDHVDLDVYSGEIQALLGENGAGKTTLMQIRYGLYRPDAGEIWIDGKRMVMRSPKEAIRAGIGMVFQDFTLIPSLTVAENIALAAPGSRVFMRRQSLMAPIQQLAVRYELPIEPSCPVWQLSIGEQQRVEILKLLHRRARLLIVDEPSTVITPQESETLLQSLRRLAAAGHAVILITHKLEEALTVAHRITVLRHGRVVAQPDPAYVNRAALARMMMGGASRATHTSVTASGGGGAVPDRGKRSE
jgi:general nucleoside transport system ATP-binding protein